MLVGDSFLHICSSGIFVFLSCKVSPMNLSFVMVVEHVILSCGKSHWALESTFVSSPR